MKKLLEEGYIKSRYLDRTIQVGNIQKMKRFFRSTQFLVLRPTL